jgi:hypothetical protein
MVPNKPPFVRVVSRFVLKTLQRKAYEDAVMWLQEEARARKDADNHVETLVRAASVAYNRGRSPRSSQRSTVDDADDAAMS